jgi:hypothetical protein
MGELRFVKTRAMTPVIFAPVAMDNVQTWFCL